MKRSSAGRLLRARTRAIGRLSQFVSTIPLNTVFLIGFIGCSAILIGPVNLFWIAGAGRRHRLFWTTPVISLSASLLLAIFIVLQDGFGGSGARVIMMQLLPDQKKAVIVQEQAAHTGVLLSKGFSTPDDLYLTPVDFRSSGTGQYEQTGRAFAGDWFSSRRVQAHRATAIMPSRAEVQWLNAVQAKDGAPADPRVEHPRHVGGDPFH